MIVPQVYDSIHEALIEIADETERVFNIERDEVLGCNEPRLNDAQMVARLERLEKAQVECDEAFKQMSSRLERMENATTARCFYFPCIT